MTLFIYIYNKKEKRPKLSQVPGVPYQWWIYLFILVCECIRETQGSSCESVSSSPAIYLKFVFSF